METSAWNYYFADDTPNEREITREFFSLVDKQIFDIYFSEVVIEEINRAQEPKKGELFKLIQRCSPVNLELTSEAKELAQRYLQEGIVPPRKKEDAAHVAIATVEEMDVVISWNYRHLANIRKAELFNSVNLAQGYTKRIEILTPMGVIIDESR